MGDEGAQNVQVCLRIRPLIPIEKKKGEKAVIFPDQVRDPNTEVKCQDKLFTYDFVFHMDRTQNDLYVNAITPLANQACQGYNVTLFAYGQTGSGKTYTMGTERADQGHRDEESMGILPRFSNDIFRYISSLPENQEMLMTCTFMELYNEQIVDLLDPTPVQRDPATGLMLGRQKLMIKEDATGVNVEGLTHMPVKSTEEILDEMDVGVQARAVGATNMNSTSSRSHAVFTLHITKSNITILDDAVEGETEVRESTLSKIHFVDLAGSERLSKTGAEGKQMKEGVAINLGLLALGNVINTLADEKKQKAAAAAGQPLFVPYRDSKLTRILQDSLGGNSKTLMLACASPAAYNQEETLTTLRYADRARAIKNKAVVNRDAVSEQIHQLKMQVKALQLALVNEHFALDPPLDSHSKAMENEEYAEYINSLMEMKVDVDDSEMPSVFTDFANNPMANNNRRRGAKIKEEEISKELLNKDEVKDALAQIMAAQDKAKQVDLDDPWGDEPATPSGSTGGPTPRRGSTDAPRSSRGGSDRNLAPRSARKSRSSRGSRDAAPAPSAAGFSGSVNLDAIKKTLEHFEELQDKHNQLQLQQTKVNEERGSLLTHMTHMAAVFDRRGDYEFALEMYQRALSMKEQSLGADHPSTAATLWSMAEVCGNRRDYNNALSLFQRALSVLEENFGHEHKDIGIVLNNIALVHSHNGNDEHAIFVYKKALNLKIKLLGESNMSVADTRTKMGKVYAKTGQYFEAMDQYNKSLKTTMKVKGQDAPENAEMLEEMASISFKQNKLDQAINYYMRALTVREVAYGVGSPNSLDTLRKLSTAYEMKQDWKLAYTMQEKLLQVQQKTSQTKATKEANALLSRATASGNQAAQKQAMEMYQRALVEHKNETAGILGRMGTSAKNFDKGKAIEAYKRALQIKENSRAMEHKAQLDKLKQ